MCVLIFSKTFLWNIPHYKKNGTRYHKNVYVLVFLQSNRYSCPILTKLEFCRQIFEKIFRSDFMKISSVGAEVFHGDRRTDGQTDRHDEANSCFLQFCKRTKKNRTFCPRSVCVFCIYLWPNIDFPSIQHKLIGFYNRDEVFTARYGLLLEASSLSKKMPKYTFLSLCWWIPCVWNDAVHMCTVCNRFVLIRYMLYLYDIFHILLSFWLTCGSMERM
jgi:hypothetical protein